MPNQEEISRAFRREANRGRCLHFDRGARCDQIIQAHSIQRAGQLQHIAEGGKVYTYDASLSALKRGKGIPSFRTAGIGNISTFPGFCKKHDNTLFAPIDNDVFRMQPQTALLYSYRCICKEFFAKENALRFYARIIKMFETKEQKEFFGLWLLGTQRGLDALREHKSRYERLIESKTEDEIRFVFFEFESTWNIQVSGLRYPDFDFLGNHLQQIGDGAISHLITAFTAPTERGWGFCFAWEKSSDEVCTPFILSLARQGSLGVDFGTCMLRFIVSSCENTAYRISWMDALPVTARKELEYRLAMSATPDIPISSNYLAIGCEGILPLEEPRVYQSHKLA